MKATLRAAQAADAPAIAALLIASRRTHLPYAPIAHPDHDVQRWVAGVLLPTQAVTVAVADDGTLAGVLATAIVDGVGWIEQLYLAPALVGRGLGTRLLQGALATLPRPVRLYTFEANAGARRFYERHGFRALAFSDGSGNEERCPDVLYELATAG
ncbi:GNAT family N-acetyltransferase [Aquabacterium humicola]|uniref:GNAT family N-acetyltransferase n=1 Tax=Aquabacterium humicola TaxID=3237377 RepID=UPI0025426E02|nr:GNAT family N-acetyltransferase [Rubrivivax pictus]